MTSQTTNASWIDSWLDGYAKGSDGQPDNTPSEFTPAAAVEWLKGWKSGDLDRQVKELGYE